MYNLSEMNGVCDIDEKIGILMRCEGSIAPTHHVLDNELR